MPKKKGIKNDGSAKETKPNPDNMKMINLAVNGVTLLREDLIDKFRKALYPHTNNSETEFLKVCKEANIKDEIAAELYKGLTEGFAPTEVDVWV